MYLFRTPEQVLRSSADRCAVCWSFVGPSGAERREDPQRPTHCTPIRQVPVPQKSRKNPSLALTKPPFKRPKGPRVGTDKATIRAAQGRELALTSHHSSGRRPRVGTDKVV
ncbi:hypothetical protein Ddc_23898 [Ditylenchus destructor]|nr:hypothetical protein Ddc_23898 [Ditylenchus destructor]